MNTNIHPICLTSETPNIEIKQNLKNLKDDKESDILNFDET